MEIKTNELSGIALDWAVAKCEGAHPQISYPDKRLFGAIGDTFDYSTNWAQGGAIIERELIDLFTEKHIHPVSWVASVACYQNGHRLVGWRFHQYGPTPLIAAMRCFVTSRLGEEVEVPDELI